MACEIGEETIAWILSPCLQCQLRRVWRHTGQGFSGMPLLVHGGCHSVSQFSRQRARTDPATSHCTMDTGWMDSWSVCVMPVVEATWLESFSTFSTTFCDGINQLFFSKCSSQTLQSSVQRLSVTDDNNRIRYQGSIRQFPIMAERPVLEFLLIKLCQRKTWDEYTNRNLPKCRVPSSGCYIESSIIFLCKARPSSRLKFRSAWWVVFSR